MSDAGRTAHPRVCGENLPFEDVSFQEAGSSPRVRGKLHVGHSRHSSLGLIPACAGKTKPIMHESVKCGAHPRVCGENQYLQVGGDSDAGSSPRVRGKLHVDNEGAHACGLIPACAGKTKSTNVWAWSPRAHPRVCGENFRWLPGVLGLRGSSPRVRGKRAFCAVGPGRAGLIPACAGKTRRAYHPHQPQPAHPRVCGENVCFKQLTTS